MSSRDNHPLHTEPRAARLGDINVVPRGPVNDAIMSLRRPPMSKHRSFFPSNFSLRELPGFFFVYAILAGICVLVGLTLQVLPSFWGGLLCGVGIGSLSALLLLHERRKIVFADLPEPSASVREMCADSNCRFPSRTFADAVKAYCDETGVSLSEGTELLKVYIAKHR